MPKQEGPFWTSRDFSLRMTCKNKKCILYDQGNATCLAPSVIEINDRGQCEFYQKQLKEKESGQK